MPRCAAEKCYAILLKNRIENPEDLKAFTWEGFAYDEGRSTDEHLQFTLV